MESKHFRVYPPHNGEIVEGNGNKWILGHTRDILLINKMFRGTYRIFGKLYFKLSSDGQYNIAIRFIVLMFNTSLVYY